jgi:hypothetical protein
MKTTKILCLLIFMFAIALSSVSADSPVWKIVKGDNQLYIGGTIHILTQADYPLPESFEKAYAAAAILVFETDMQKIKTPEFQQLLMSKVVYPEGRSLKTVLNQATYQKLEEHFASRGIPLGNLVKFKPGMVAMTMTIIELQRLGLLGTGVDEFFNLRAINDQKELGQLETIDQQAEFLSTMGQGRENELISRTLRDLKKLPTQLQTMKDAWRQGDDRKLKEVALTPFKNDFPDLYQQLIVKRNNAWIDKIEAMLATQEIELILVGALHLVGEDGVLALLAERGYQIQKP